MVGHFVGRRILIVEDEHLLAIELEDELRELGAVVVGPASSVDAGMALLRLETVEGAILDINLGGEMVFGLADELVGRGIPPPQSASSFAKDALSPLRWDKVRAPRPLHRAMLLQCRKPGNSHPRR